MMTMKILTFSAISAYSLAVSTAALVAVAFIPSHSVLGPRRNVWVEPIHWRTTAITKASTKSDIDKDDHDGTFRPLLQLATAHFASQALYAAIQLCIPDLLWKYEQQQRQQENDQRGDDALFVPLHVIASSISPPCHIDTLLRMMRLLTTIDIVKEIEVVESRSTKEEHPSSTNVAFRLTKLGRALSTAKASQSVSSNVSLPSASAQLPNPPPTMASCFLHWMESPLWNSWLELTDFIRTPYQVIDPVGIHDSVDDMNTVTQTKVEPCSTTPSPPSHSKVIRFPFERANNGISSDYWYNKEEHPESLYHANQFVRLIHEKEVQAVVEVCDWSKIFFGGGKHRVVDIGGHHGQLLTAIATATMRQNPESSVEWFSLDLADVIDRADESGNRLVKLVKGDVFETATIPHNCDTIIMKHFLDRCMWSEVETIQILQSCHAALAPLNDGNDTMPTTSESITGAKAKRLIIAEAVLPDYGQVTPENQLSLYLDAMYSLVGRDRQRTRREWAQLAAISGFEVESIYHTTVPSCSLLVLKRLD